MQLMLVLEVHAVKESKLTRVKEDQFCKINQVLNYLCKPLGNLTLVVR